jgi:transcriptional regulator GlxA family with amidase domain
MNQCLETIDWEALARQCRGKVETMASHTLTSRRTIERHFKQKWGESPARWAKRKLLEQAMMLIRKGYSNKAVVEELQLCSESWFCREFHAAFGMPPQAFHPFRAPTVVTGTV